MIASLVGLVVLAGVAVWLRRRYLVVTVYGRSMLPSYRDGDRLLVRRTSADRLGEGVIVVFRSPDVPDQAALADEVGAVRSVLPDDRLLIKRVAALPGDPVPADRVPVLAATGDVAVPAGVLVVLGDNPDVSHDSRAYGYLPGSHVVGVAVRRM